MDDYSSLLIPGMIIGGGKTRYGIIRNRSLTRGEARKIFPTNSIMRRMMLGKTWHFFEEQVSPYKSSFLQHVAGGGDKLDWLEKLKSTEKRERERGRLFYVARNHWKMRFQGFGTKISTFFLFECFFYSKKFYLFPFFFFFLFTKKKKRTHHDYFPCVNVTSESFRIERVVSLSGCQEKSCEEKLRGNIYI